MIAKGILESRAEIADLVHLYAFNVRARLGRECGALFTDEATFEVREADPLDPAAARTRSSLSGRSTIADYIARTSESELLVWPLIHNLLIEVHGDTARSSCVMTTRTWPLDHEMIGEYQNSYRRDSAWRFESRIFTIILGSTAPGFDDRKT